MAYKGHSFRKPASRPCSFRICNCCRVAAVCQLFASGFVHLSAGDAARSAGDLRHGGFAFRRGTGRCLRQAGGTDDHGLLGPGHRQQPRGARQAEGSCGRTGDSRDKQFAQES